MASLNDQVLGRGAFANVNADAVAPAFLLNRGFSGLVRNAAGDYSLTLQNAIDYVNAGQVFVSLVDAAGAAILQIIPVSNTVIRIGTFNLAGAGVDLNFQITIQEVASA